MANSWFQFKQFRIDQGDCAMKVSTDACLQGAIAARHLITHPPAGNRVLDIGAGTGLLSLMIAQAGPDLKIDAVEADYAAYKQCRQNFSNSPWRSRLSVHAGTVQALPHDISGFSFIISNPPFFENQLPAPSKLRRLARHAAELNLEDLITAVALRLAPQGRACLLYPAGRRREIEETAIRHGFATTDLYHIHPSAQKKANRIVIFLAHETETRRPPTEEKIVIYDRPGNYSAHFRQLLSDFYLGQ